MQLFSLSALLPALQTAVATPATLPSADAIAADFARIQAGIRPGIVLLWVAVSQVLAILAYWISSNLVAREEGRFLNALKLWGIYIAAFIGVGILFAIGMGFGAKQPSMIFASVVVGIMLVIVAILGCPMKVYKLGVGGALGFVLIVWVLNIAGQVAVARFLPQPLDFLAWAEFSRNLAALPTVEQTKLIERITHQAKTPASAAAVSDETIAADQSKSIEDRHAAVQRIYRDLEVRRAGLKPGDADALAAYTRDETRYQDLLRQLQADASAAAPK